MPTSAIQANFQVRKWATNTYQKKKMGKKSPASAALPMMSPSLDLRVYTEQSIAFLNNNYLNLHTFQILTSHNSLILTL